MPAMDLIVTGDAFIVKADVPGYGKDQIEIDAQGQQLHIRGKHIEQPEQKDEHHHTKERFQSTVTLPISRRGFVTEFWKFKYPSLRQRPVGFQFNKLLCATYL